MRHVGKYNHYTRTFTYQSKWDQLFIDIVEDEYWRTKIALYFYQNWLTL